MPCYCHLIFLWNCQLKKLLIFFYLKELVIILKTTTKEINHKFVIELTNDDDILRCYGSGYFSEKSMTLIFLVFQISQVYTDPHSPVRDSWGGVCSDDRGTDWRSTSQCQPVLWTLLQFFSGTTKRIKRDRPCHNMA